MRSNQRNRSSRKGNGDINATKEQGNRHLTSQSGPQRGHQGHSGHQGAARKLNPANQMFLDGVQHSQLVLRVQVEFNFLGRANERAGVGQQVVPLEWFICVFGADVLLVHKAPLICKLCELLLELVFFDCLGHKLFEVVPIRLAACAMIVCLASFERSPYVTSKSASPFMTWCMRFFKR